MKPSNGHHHPPGDDDAGLSQHIPNEQIDALVLGSPYMKGVPEPLRPRAIRAATKALLREVKRRPRLLIEPEKVQDVILSAIDHVLQCEYFLLRIIHLDLSILEDLHISTAPDAELIDTLIHVKLAKAILLVWTGDGLSEESLQSFAEDGESEAARQEMRANPGLTFSAARRRIQRTVLKIRAKLGPIYDL